LLFVAAHMVSVAMFFIAARYRISVVPVLLIFASMAIIYAVDSFRKKQNKKLALYCIVAGCAALFVYFPWQGVSNKNFLAYTYNNMGLFYSANNNVAAARQYYESAMHECPGFWKPYNNLGNLYLACGEKEKALSCYLQGLQKGLPRDSSAMFIHMSLGTYYLKEEGNIEEARKHYAQASPYVPYSLMMRQLRNELKL